MWLFGALNVCNGERLWEGVEGLGELGVGEWSSGYDC